MKLLNEVMKFMLKLMKLIKLSNRCWSPRLY